MNHACSASLNMISNVHCFFRDLCSGQEAAFYMKRAAHSLTSTTREMKMSLAVVLSVYGTDSLLSAVDKACCSAGFIQSGLDADAVSLARSLSLHRSSLGYECKLTAVSSNLPTVNPSSPLSDVLDGSSSDVKYCFPQALKGAVNIFQRA